MRLELFLPILAVGIAVFGVGLAHLQIRKDERARQLGSPKPQTEAVRMTHSPDTPAAATISMAAVLDAITSHVRYDDDWGDLVDAVLALPQQREENELRARVTELEAEKAAAEADADLWRERALNELGDNLNAKATLTAQPEASSTELTQGPADQVHDQASVDHGAAQPVAQEPVAGEKRGDRIIDAGFPDGWFIQDRLDDNVALLCRRSDFHYGGWVCICLRPKALTTDHWIPQAQIIAKGFDAIAHPATKARAQSSSVGGEAKA